MLDRPVRLSQIEERLAEVVMAGGMGGVEGDRLLKAGDRLRVAILGIQEAAQVVPGPPQPWIDLDSAAIMFCRLLNSPRVLQDDRQIAVQFCVVRPRPQGA